MKCGHAEGAGVRPAAYNFLLSSPLSEGTGGMWLGAGGYNPLLCFPTAVQRQGYIWEVAQLSANHFLSVLPKTEHPCKDATPLVI